MKKLLTRKEGAIISILAVGISHLFLQLVGLISHVIPLNHKFLGEINLQNFDGIYYILIAQNGYGAYQQAFFPLFPVLIRIFSEFFNISALASALLIVNVSLFTFLYLLLRLVSLDYGKRIAIWTAIFYLVFPTSFFLFAVYTESLFLALVICSFYFWRRGNVLTASIFGGLASATRIVGVSLLPVYIIELIIKYKKKEFNLRTLLRGALPLFLIPSGLIAYMTFLFYKYQDALLFIHVQPAFGAGRSGNNIVLLPQVIWRYIKILTTISYASLDFFIASLELFLFFASLVILYIAWRKKMNIGYVLFALFVIIFPTLSGTLSSMPRYMLAAFSIFIFLAGIKSRVIKITFVVVLVISEVVLTALFMRGYFVS